MVASQVTAIVFLLSLTWISVASFEIRYLEHGGVLEIKTGHSNYALNQPSSENNDWKTFAVNGNTVTITTKDCQVQTKNLRSLGSTEENSLLAVKGQIEGIELRYRDSDDSPNVMNLMKESNDFVSTKFESTGTQTNENSLIKTSGSTLSVSGSNGLIFDKLGDTLTVGGKVFENLLRVAQNNQVFASVSNNGEIQMKPVNCMSQEEQQKMSQFRQEFEEVSGTKLNKQAELPVVRAQQKSVNQRGLNVYQGVNGQQIQDWNNNNQQQSATMYTQQLANQQQQQSNNQWPQSNQYGLQQYSNQQQLPSANQWSSQFNQYNQQPYQSQQMMQQPYQQQQQQMQQPYQSQQYYQNQIHQQQQQWPQQQWPQLSQQAQGWPQQQVTQQYYQQQPQQQYYQSYQQNLQQQPQQQLQQTNQQQQTGQWGQQQQQQPQQQYYQSYQQNMQQQPQQQQTGQWGQQQQQQWPQQANQNIQSDPSQLSQNLMQGYQQPTLAVG